MRSYTSHFLSNKSLYPYIKYETVQIFVATLALWEEGLKCGSAILVQTEISQLLDGLPPDFIQSTAMFSNNVTDFSIVREMSQQLLFGAPWNVAQIFMVDFGDF